jgi:hypothetical protein
MRGKEGEEKEQIICFQQQIKIKNSMTIIICTRTYV